MSVSRGFPLCAMMLLLMANLVLMIGCKKVDRGTITKCTVCGKELSRNVARVSVAPWAKTDDFIEISQTICEDCKAEQERRAAEEQVRRQEAERQFEAGVGRARQRLQSELEAICAEHFSRLPGTPYTLTVEREDVISLAVDAGAFNRIDGDKLNSAIVARIAVILKECIGSEHADRWPWKRYHRTYYGGGGSTWIDIKP